MATPPRVPPKPKITLQIPPPQTPNSLHGGRPSSTAGINPMYNQNFNYNMARTPADATDQYYNPFQYMYQNKASDFMFKQFEGFKDFTMNTAKSGLSVGEKSAFWMYNKFRKWSRKWFTHIFLFIVIVAYTAAGAAIFVAVEGVHEKVTSKDIKLREIELVEELRLMSKNPALIEDPDMWNGEALKRLSSYKAQVTEWVKQGSTDKGKKVWSFWNAMFYCGTIYTTIGYGHIAPSTTTGRALTIVYAIIGIPLFLILLADFGKLFTRCIKFVWAFVRRLYYTGSCRKVRRTVQVQEVMKGLNMVYTAASTFRRPSQYGTDEEVGQMADGAPQRPPKPNQNLLTVPDPSQKPNQEQNQDAVDQLEQDPQTPAPSVFEIDDEFNLPISVAITCWTIYIFMGASIYVVWEEWSFFESFYFVFISMSTIGFGDFVPNHPIYMMGSIVYLVFGMALTSMCINVVQEKLSDSFRQASAKIGATMGLRVSDEDGSLAPITPPPVEIPAVHGTSKNDTPEIV